MTITIDREMRHIDKSAWGDGPWRDEADKLQWIDEKTGFDCLIVRVPWSGHLCGYVGVTEDHPAFGKSYDEANELATPDEDDYRSFRVHGGLTFADSCQEGEEDTGICHVPQTGRPDRVWWLGFDAAHCDDISPATDSRSSYQRHNPRAAYRTVEYMQNECADLATQLKAVVDGSQS